MAFNCCVCGKYAEKTYAVRINLVTGLPEGICSEECLNEDLARMKKVEGDGHEP